MTVREFLEIYSDLDAYIARGGRLLDLDMIPFDDLPGDILAFITEELGEPRLERLRRFFAAIEELARKVGGGKIVDEDQLRMLWQRTQVGEPLH